MPPRPMKFTQLFDYFDRVPILQEQEQQETSSSSATSSKAPEGRNTPTASFMKHGRVWSLTTVKNVSQLNSGRMEGKRKRSPPSGPKIFSFKPQPMKRREICQAGEKGDGGKEKPLKKVLSRYSRFYTCQSNTAGGSHSSEIWDTEGT
ncbi:conserved hypothetical protein [Ricinus communis]|uniref:Uncharacterized protein n=1 Tax=Ricinus communis TaxID=3988 RepID=B9RW46_RICCO|nr:conserved hypothetical protein [Ricinus communis]